MTIYWKTANGIANGTVITVSKVRFPKESIRTVYHVKMKSGLEMDVLEESITQKEQ